MVRGIDASGILSGPSGLGSISVGACPVEQSTERSTDSSNDCRTVSQIGSDHVIFSSRTYLV